MPEVRGICWMLRRAGDGDSVYKWKAPTYFHSTASFASHEVENYIIEVLHNTIGTDEILIKIATQNPTQVLMQNIKDHFRAKLRVMPKIEFHDKKIIQQLQFPKFSRKPVMVVDKRKFIFK